MSGALGRRSIEESSRISQRADAPRVPLSAFLDVNDSGGGPPDPEEPFGWYVDQDGLPQQIVISEGNTVNDVDILLEDPFKMIFLPLLLK